MWETVPCPHQGGPITGYRLHYSNNGSDSYTVNITGEQNKQFKLTGLTPSTSYSVQVAAVNDKGAGPYSTPLTGETLQDSELKTTSQYAACVLLGESKTLWGELDDTLQHRSCPMK